MPEVEVRKGMFAWADLSTSDVPAAKAFYGGLFGWDFADVAAGEHGVYTLCRMGGRDVVGMGPQPPGEADMGIPPMWTCHVSVDDVDGVTARATELGGSVVMGPMDVADAGRLSVLRDPTGGVVCLWEPRGHRGAGVFNEAGAMTWNELATRDQSGAAAFYGELFGWEFEDMDSPGGPYKVIHNEARPNGGILQMNDEWPAEVPPHWSVYFWVDDVEASTAKVEELGGSVHVPPFDIGVGTMSVVADPQGASFTLFNGKAGPMV